MAGRLQAIHARMEAAARLAGRDPRAITLLAVSKGWPAAAVAEALAAGQHRFGESYVQEAVGKIRALAGRGIEWHFIGPLQSNKTRPVAEHFAWVHSVDRLHVAERLSRARSGDAEPLQVCVQVNVSGEASKSGVAPDEAPALAQAVAALPGLRLRGLMTIPEPSEDEVLQQRRFATLRALFDRLNAAGLALDTLSMGMSDDLEAAIHEGATVVRVGTAIFGTRPARAGAEAPQPGGT